MVIAVSEIIVERDGFTIVIKSFSGDVKEEDIPIALKAIEALLNTSSGQPTSSGAGREYNKKNNGNGNGTNKYVHYSPWLLTWIAEVNGYRDNYHAILSIFINRKQQ